MRWSPAPTSSPPPGRPAEGLELLAAATTYAPGTEWAGVPWVTAPELAERLDPERIARVLMQVCAALPDPVPRIGRAPLTPYLTLARNAATVHPEHGLLLGAASALARRLGEVELAVRWATRGVRAQPSKMGEVWLGYAYRSSGRTRDGLAALGRAVELDPDDLAIYADIAGTLAEIGRLDEALEWTERALARDPSFDCAVHTAHRLRHLRDGDLAHLVALADFVRDHPDDSHEHGDLAQCCRGRPWLGQLTPAGGPLVDAMRQAVADDDNGLGGAVRLPAAAPPSAVGTAISTAPGLRIEVVGTPEPDPREPRRAVRSRGCGTTRMSSPRPRWRRPRRRLSNGSRRSPTRRGRTHRRRTTRRWAWPASTWATCSACWCTRRRRRPTRWVGCWPPTTRRSGSAACRCGPVWGCCTTAPTSRGRARPDAGCCSI